MDIRAKEAKTFISKSVFYYLDLGEVNKAVLYLKSIIFQYRILRLSAPVYWGVHNYPSATLHILVQSVVVVPVVLSNFNALAANCSVNVVWKSITEITFKITWLNTAKME